MINDISSMTERRKIYEEAILDEETLKNVKFPKGKRILITKNLRGQLFWRAE